MTALHKWKSAHQVDLRPNRSPVLKALRKALRTLQCEELRPGIFSHGHGVGDLSSPLGFLPRLQHIFRQHWRTMNFTTWLNSSRRDAAIARSVNLQVTDMLISKLREQARDLSAWETTIMCGGMWAEAHCKPSERPHICPQCEERMIPSVHHILWECSMWSHLRLLPCPTNDLTSRLGWNQHGACLPILRQCGNIRREHVKLRRTQRCAGICGYLSWQPCATIACYDAAPMMMLCTAVCFHVSLHVITLLVWPCACTIVWVCVQFSLRMFLQLLCNCMYVCLYRFVCFFGWKSLCVSVHVNYSQVCVYGQLFLSLGLCAYEFFACLCAGATVCLPLCTGIVLCAPVRVDLLDRFYARSSFVRACACAQFVSLCQLCFCLSPSL